LPDNFFILKKTYFISDIHLGFPNETESRQREKLLLQWFDETQKDAEAIYILGDLFDFWFEYRKTVPKYFTRTIGKLAELADAGIEMHLFTGNHDLWMFGYFEEELGIPVHRQPLQKEIHGKTFYMAHGDGLGPGDYGYKILKKIFTSDICSFIFRWLHPDIGVSLAHYWSRESRFADGIAENYKGADKEWLLIFSKELENKTHHDFFIFGHRHLPLDIRINDSSRYINLGDWLIYHSYAVFDGHTLELKSFTHHKDVPLLV
jgi:UDP-2,3-diacylglucosamine hydrolase